jgi:hypothetical protein
MGQRGWSTNLDVASQHFDAAASAVKDQAHDGDIHWFDEVLDLDQRTELDAVNMDGESPESMSVPIRSGARQKENDYRADSRRYEPASRNCFEPVSVEESSHISGGLTTCRHHAVATCLRLTHRRRGCHASHSKEHIVKFPEETVCSWVIDRTAIGFQLLTTTRGAGFCACNPPISLLA